jgi:hypothetical protein
MRIAMQSVSVTDKMRRAVNFHYGKPGLATRDEMRGHLEAYGDSAWDDFISELDEDEPLTRAAAH